MKTLLTIVLLAGAAMAATPALAAGEVNLGFEQGNLGGYTTNGGGGAAGVGTSYGSYGAAEGSFLGFVRAGLGTGIYTTLTRTFTFAAGQTLTGKVGFQGADYLPYNDDAYLSVNGVNLFASNIAAVGSYGATGFQSFSFTAPTAGSYTLQLGVRNALDNSASSGAVLDGLAISAVPEPATWAMLIAGFGVVGGALRSSRRSAGALATA